MPAGHSGASDRTAPVTTGADDTEATRLTVPTESAGERLDRFVALALGGVLSRVRVQALIADGHVTIDGVVAAEAKRRVVEGTTIELVVPDAVAPDPMPEAIELSILYEDGDLIVVDKPAGLVVHPGPGNWTGTLVNALLHHCGDSLSGIGGVKRPGIVHRLDKETSGVMVVAKNDAAHRALADQFASHGRDGRMERAYRAVVWGAPSSAKGSIDAALGRSNTDRTKRTVVPETRTDARHAVTHYTLEQRFGQPVAIASLLAFKLETGRTHQIRVHSAHIGHPLIGDAVYGSGFRTKANVLPEPAATVVRTFTRQALHAFRLGFVHPASGQPMSFETPLPKDMTSLISALSEL